jgi:hypothetical protein
VKKSQRRNRWIMGSAIGAAAIAVAVDHTRHRLPVAAPPASSRAAEDGAAVVIIIDEEAESPCGLDVAPCSLDDNPCGLGVAPCSLDES